MPTVLFEFVIPEQFRSLFQVPLSLKLYGNRFNLGLFRPHYAIPLIPNDDYSVFTLKLDLPHHSIAMYKVLFYKGETLIGEDFQEHNFIMHCMLLKCPLSSYYF